MYIVHCTMYSVHVTGAPRLLSSAYNIIIIINLPAGNIASPLLINIIIINLPVGIPSTPPNCLINILSVLSYIATILVLPNHHHLNGISIGSPSPPASSYSLPPYINYHLAYRLMSLYMRIAYIHRLIGHAGESRGRIVIIVLTPLTSTTLSSSSSSSSPCSR